MLWLDKMQQNSASVRIGTCSSVRSVSMSATCADAFASTALTLSSFSFTRVTSWCREKGLSSLPIFNCVGAGALLRCSPAALTRRIPARRARRARAPSLLYGRICVARASVATRSSPALSKAKSNFCQASGERTTGSEPSRIAS